MIIGSTEKMGVGTNIQDRCVALHHLDCPWRPADIEQREGRGVRQGNQNPEIHIYRYAVEGSFDAYSWQTVERKARFINQVMRGRLEVREIDDIGENTLSFAEVKALASGDPLILDKARADADVTRLSRLERAWQRNQHTLTHAIAGGQERLKTLHAHLAALAAAIAQRHDTRADAFSMIVDGRHADKRADAAELLARRLATIAPGQTVPVARLGGLAIDGTIRLGSGRERHVELALHGLPAAPATLETTRLTDSSLSLVRQLEHRLEDLPALQARIEQQQRESTAELARAREQLTRPFKYAAQLADARTRQTRIDEAMKARAAPPEPPASATHAADIDAALHAAFPAPANTALGTHRDPGSPRARERDARPSRQPARERYR